MKQLLQHVITLPQEQQLDALLENEISYLSLLENIKSDDQQLREQLAVQIFMTVSNEVDTSYLIEATQKLLSDEFLFYDTKNTVEHSVIIRSTSALWLTILLQLDASRRFLSGEEATTLIEKASSYLAKERDVRGLTEVGWANAATNAINLYITLLHHPNFEIRNIPTMLLGISKAMRTDYVFIDDEENRFAAFIQLLSTRDYPEEVIIEWIEQLFDQLQFSVYEEGYTNAFYHHKTNLLHFMQALYFKLKFTHTYPKVQATSSIFISKWM